MTPPETDPEAAVQQLVIRWKIPRREARRLVYNEGVEAAARVPEERGEA